MVEVPALFVHWEGFVRWLLVKTAGFPKRLRPALTARIEGHALDVFEAIVEARYDVDRIAALRRVNLGLEKLRLLMRLAHDLGALDHHAFESAAHQVETAGRMTGGWLKQAGGPT